MRYPLRLLPGISGSKEESQPSGAFAAAPRLPVPISLPVQEAISRLLPAPSECLVKLHKAAVFDAACFSECQLRRIQ